MMKEQKEKTKKIEVTFEYWLSKNGQLSSDKILTEKQTVTGEVEVPISAIKNKLKGDGTLYHFELSPRGLSTNYENLYFDRY